MSSACGRRPFPCSASLLPALPLAPRSTARSWPPPSPLPHPTPHPTAPSHHTTDRYFDTIVGTGPVAEEGRRVVVHFEAKWKGVTFITSRQGMGVTGGTPLGFDVGAKPGVGGTLKVSSEEPLGIFQDA